MSGVDHSQQQGGSSFRSQQLWLLCKSSYSFYFFGFDPLHRNDQHYPFFVLPAIMGSHSEQISGIYANFRMVNLPSGRNSQSIGSAIITHRFDPRFSLLSLFKCQAFTQHNTGSPNYSGPSIKVSFLHQQIYAVTISSFCSMDFRRWPLWPGALKDTYSSKHDTVYTRMLGSAKLDIRLITSLISYIIDI